MKIKIESKNVWNDCNDIQLDAEIKKALKQKFKLEAINNEEIESYIEINDIKELIDIINISNELNDMTNENWIEFHKYKEYLEPTIVIIKNNGY